MQPQGMDHTLGRTLAAAPVVLDSNVVLDLWLFEEPAVARLRHAIENRELIWLSSMILLDEVRHVLDRDFSTINKAVSTNKSAVLAACQHWAQLRSNTTPTENHRPVCRDPDDQKFVDLAVRHAPAWLLSRDKAVLALAKRARNWRVRIATPLQWLKDGLATSA